MPLLIGNLVKLRAMEPSDIKLLYKWENDSEIWKVSNTNTPVSKALIEKFIDYAAKDIYSTKQLRLMIVDLKSKNTIGTVDLFDFDPMHNRAGIGILISKKYRNNGFASETVCLIKEWAFSSLNLHQLYCNILENNDISFRLFSNEGFTVVGNKKEWVNVDNKYYNEFLLQCIRK